MQVELCPLSSSPLAPSPFCFMSLLAHSHFATICFQVCIFHWTLNYLNAKTVAFYLCVPRFGSNEWMHLRSDSWKDGGIFLCRCSSKYELKTTSIKCIDYLKYRLPGPVLSLSLGQEVSPESAFLKSILPSNSDKYY